MRQVVLLITCLSILAAKMVVAQTSPEANLSQVHVGVGYMPVIQFSPGNFPYQPSQFFRLTAGVNYLKGYIKGNCQYTKIIANNPSVYPTSLMFDNSIGYLYSQKLFKQIHLFGGGQIGLNAIFFDVEGTNLSSNRSSEIEMSAGIELGVEYRFYKNFGLSASVKQQRIFATPNNNLVLADFGLTYYFNPKTGLKKWLE